MRKRPGVGVVVVTAASVAVSFLTVCVPAVVAAQGSPAAGGVEAHWAYGVVHSASRHGLAGLTAWEASRTVGFAVVLAQSPPVGGTYTVDVNRTMGLILSVEYCRLTCSTPSRSASVTFHAWEAIAATLAFTSHASVSVGGTSTAALGLSSSRLAVEVGLRETAAVYAAGDEVGSRNFTVGVNASSGTTFSPPLGLLPANLTGPMNWNASSAYVEAGEANWSVVGKSSGSLATTNVDLSGAVPLAATGTVSVAGNFTGSTVNFDKASYDAVNLTVTGPFGLREGFLLAPDAADLFGPAAPSWLAGSTTDSSASATVSQSSIDVASALVAGSHLGFEASGTKWRYGTSDLSTYAPEPATAALGPAVVPAAGAGNSTYLQGSPETVGQATTDQNCLATGVGCPAAGAPRELVRFLLLAGGIVVVAAVIAMLVAERRRLPPPPYPNAALYPPGGATNAGPTGPARRPGRPPTPAEDDPLNHLW